MILADKIIDLRKKNGWSQEELAEKLGVSRQAVSKWESAQAIPDLGRVLAMADLFSVTTDYLLRDENEAPTPATMEDSAPDSSVRRVSMEEASAFLALCRKQAPTRALAVSLCVLSPIPLLMILSRTGEGPAAGVGSIIGVVILLLLVTAAVIIFLRQGMESKEYEYLEQEDIETAYGVSGMVKEKQTAYRETCTRGIIVGVVLCILSAIPVLLGTLAADSVAAPERICSSDCCRSSRPSSLCRWSFSCWCISPPATRRPLCWVRTQRRRKLRRSIRSWVWMTRSLCSISAGWAIVCGSTSARQPPSSISLSAK